MSVGLPTIYILADRDKTTMKSVGTCVPAVPVCATANERPRTPHCHGLDPATSTLTPFPPPDIPDK